MKFGKPFRSIHLIRKLFCTVLLGIVTFSCLNSEVLAKDQSVSFEQAEQVFENLSPQEKVGQLFLVTFNGNLIDKNSKIVDLIQNYHVGGVVLSADSNNFTFENTTLAVQTLNNNLQTYAWEKWDSQQAETIDNQQRIPLFIGISQDGNGYPADQILSGLTLLPSALAIGATWDPELAREVGQVMGQELSAMGFNLYLGPSLDVLDTGGNEAYHYVGTQTFGGDPYWVGELGRAYIKGVHQGSDGRIAVIAKHFPGQGGTDRDPQLEVATVRKSLEQLKQLELAPFIAVTKGNFTGAAIADGLMVSHIRYQGFQGNIRATTRPVSFDSTALNQLMSIEPFNLWRDQGGLILSDSLGSQAVRKFFDPTGEIFDAQQVARSAFMAGNDLLFLDNFISTGDPDNYATIIKTIDFFVQKYLEDPVFAQRVDASVIRIINEKILLYGDFDLNNTLVSTDLLPPLGKSENVSLDVARNAVTLISPTKAELDIMLPMPPGTYDYMVIFTDARPAYQCSGCDPTRVLSSNSLQNSLLQLYGPAGDNLLIQSRISSYSFSQLAEMLDQTIEPSETFLIDNILRANWIIFNILDLDPLFPESGALKKLLSERIDLLQNKHVIVFGYDTPYYLDATELSKITAYYGLFSRTPAFIEVAARVLMQELDPAGALPVSVDSVRYDLITATSPDPSQVIPLELIEPSQPTQVPESTLTTETPDAPAVEMPPIFTIGETINIQTGTILDHNQNPVPDGTVVRFTVRSLDENVIVEQIDSVTVNGKAAIPHRITRGGTIEITAISEPALTSGRLVVNIEKGSAELIMPTPSPTPTMTFTPSPTATLVLIEDENKESQTELTGFPKMIDWLVVILIILGGFSIAYLVGYFWWGTIKWGLRSGLTTAIGGLFAYFFLNLGISELQSRVLETGLIYIIQIVLFGLFVGWIAALLWWIISDHLRSSLQK